MEFNTEGHSAGISYVIDGEREDAERAEAEVEQIIAHAKQWYSPIARVDLVAVLLGGLAVLWLAGAILYFVLALLGYISDRPSSPRDAALSQGFALALVASIVVVGSVGNFFRKWLFPVGVFAPGNFATGHGASPSGDGSSARLLSLGSS